MVKDAKVIIGANYGDEGKGLMTDYFAGKATANGENCVVVLSNGGSQRGHTVSVPEGLGRFIFKHLGSGTLRSASTYIPKQFVCNPMEFRKQYWILDAYWHRDGRKQRSYIYADGECLVTTPLDMMANAFIEINRKQDKHGSCRMGVWETILRKDGATLAEMKAMDSGELYVYLRRVRDYYMQQRFPEEGITDLGLWSESFFNDNILFTYIEDVKYMLRHIEIRTPYVLNQFDHLLFENGQGLLLNSVSGNAGKYTTPSNTGLEEPSKMIRETLSLDIPVEVVYVTRTYLTRHGNGPMENECDYNDLFLQKNRDIVHETNHYNLGQGKLRYGAIDIDSLLSRTSKDFMKWSDSLWKYRIAITHCDEIEIPELVGNYMSYSYDGTKIKETTNENCRHRTITKEV